MRSTRNKITWRLIVVCLGLVAALQTRAENLAEGFTNAVAFYGETQEDAPALEIFLTRKPHAEVVEPPRPYFHIEIAGNKWDHLVGKELELVPLSRQGLDPAKPIVRAEAVLEGEKPLWLKGTLRLKKAQAGEKIEASYDFADSNGRRWAGAFAANWITRKKGD